MSDHFFTNENVNTQELPSQDDLLMNGIDPKHLRANIIVTLLVFTIIASILSGVSWFTGNSQGFLPYSILGLTLIFSIIVVIEILGFKHKKYALRQNDITYQSGLIFRKTTTLPFNRIQHCEINQGPIDRIMNLSSIKVFTAGGSNSDLEVPGLNTEQAKNIKSFIVRKTALDEEE